VHDGGSPFQGALGRLNGFAGDFRRDLMRLEFLQASRDYFRQVAAFVLFRDGDRFVNLSVFQRARHGRGKNPRLFTRRSRLCGDARATIGL